MALPLPKVVADTGPGGGLVTAMGGMNALSNAMLDTQINKVKAQYAPLTTQADAASKLAYANLMGPQFLAKLMGNPDVVANSPQLQDPATVARLYQAGMGGGTGNALMQMPGSQGQPQPQSSSNPLSSWLSDKIKGITGGGSAPQPQQAQPSMNALSSGPQFGLSPQDQQRANTMQPGDSFVVGQNQGVQPQQQAPQMQEAPQAQYTLPGQPKSYAEKAGDFAGVKAEGAEMGKLRAQTINDLSDVVFNGTTKQATLDNINKIVSSPEFEQIRQTPILGHNELSYYSRYGTPAQQNMVGQLMTLSGNVIRDASQDFKGSFRKGEQELLQNMKINPGDTVDAARGKMEQLSYLNQMITQRARLTANYMQQNHASKLQAEEYADKQLNGDQIRDQIHNTINPRPTDADINFMAQKYNTTPDEIKKRLKAKGIY